MNLFKGRRERGCSQSDRVISLFYEFSSKAGSEVLVVTHANADPDAVAASLLLRESLFRCGVAHVAVAFPEGPSKLSRKVLEKLGIKLDYLSTPPLKPSVKSIAVVDASNRNQLGSFVNLINTAQYLLVLDHHKPLGDLAHFTPFVIVKEEPASTLIAYDIAKALGLKLKPPFLTLALTGILFDTRRFLYATPHSLEITARILKEGGDYSKALSLLEEKADFSERVARLKGAMRCNVLRFGRFLVAVSEVGSFEASVARALISLGADVAIVASGRRNECRVSIRISRDFYSTTGISVGRDIASKLAESLRGRGGGHDMAGGFNGKCSVEEALRAAIQILSTKVVKGQEPGAGASSKVSQRRWSRLLSS